MASILHINRWIHFPEPGDPSVRFVADAPLGSGIMQIAASNASFGGQENGLRTLWEHPGAIDIAGNLDFSGNLDSFPWDYSPGPTVPLVLFCGVHRIRPLVTGLFPTIKLKIHLASDGASTAGAILVGRRSPGRPTPEDIRDSVTTTSGTLTVKTLVLEPSASNLGSRSIYPVTGYTTPQPPPVEEGSDTAMAFYVGIWNGSGGKTQASAVTLYMEI